MHQRDDRRPSSGRPSLLTPDENAEANRDSILGQLDSKAGRAPSSKSSLSATRWIAGGAVIAALGAGAIGLALMDDTPPPKPVLAATSAPTPASAGAAVVTTADVLPSQTGEAPASNAAAIIDAPIEPGKERSLKDILTAPPRPKSSPDELAALLDKPSGAKAAVKPADSHAEKKEAKQKADNVKLAQKDKRAKERKDKEKVKEKDRDKDKDKAKALAESRKKSAAGGKSSVVDTDVALLAALVAHTKTSPSPRLSKTAIKYKQCSTLPSVAEADRCRERLCVGSGKGDPACKTQRPVKVAGES